MSTHVFESMGTVASIRYRGAPAFAGVLDAIERSLAGYDQRFSLYRADSEISRIARGEQALLTASPTMKDAYARAIAWRTRTDGAFTPERPDGVLDLSGIVKALAIESAGRLLVAAGIDDWVVNLGGDVLTGGTDEHGPWKAGVVDPEAPDRLLCAISLRPGWDAVATSGTLERGEHVWRVSPASSYRQVSVFARGIVVADVLATAILSGGEPMRDRACARWDVDVLTIDADGEITVTERLRTTMARPPR
jgi:thiamine biosynthesis lipoprotein